MKLVKLPQFRFRRCVVCACDRVCLCVCVPARADGTSTASPLLVVNPLAAKTATAVAAAASH